MKRWNLNSWRGFINADIWLFSVIWYELLLHHSGNLSMVLQSPKMCTAEGQYVISMTIITLETVSTKKILDTLGFRPPGGQWVDCERASLLRKCGLQQDLELVMQVLNFPQLWYNTIARCSTKLEVLSSIAFDKDLISLVIKCIKVTRPLLKCVNGKGYGRRIWVFNKYLWDNFNSDKLNLNLGVITKFSEEESILKQYLSILSPFHPHREYLFSEAGNVAELISVIPAANDVSEHSLTLNNLSRLICVQTWPKLIEIA